MEQIDVYLSQIEQVVDKHSTLDLIRSMNTEWKHVIFAPNHIMPESKIRREMAMSQDYWAIKHALINFDIHSLKIVHIADINRKLDTFIDKIIYEVVAKSMHIVRNILIDGYPIHMNALDNKTAQKRNYRDMKAILWWLKQDNLVLFPYGNWWPNGEQEFWTDESYDTQKRCFFDFEKNGEDIWHNGLKPGFVKLARTGNTGIVPLYIYKNPSWSYTIQVWALIFPWKNQDVLNVADQYLSIMQHLKSENDAMKILNSTV